MYDNLLCDISVHRFRSHCQSESSMSFRIQTNIWFGAVFQFIGAKTFGLKIWIGMPPGRGRGRGGGRGRGRSRTRVSRIAIMSEMNGNNWTVCTIRSQCRLKKRMRRTKIRQRKSNLEMLRLHQANSVLEQIQHHDGQTTKSNVFWNIFASIPVLLKYFMNNCSFSFAMWLQHNLFFKQKPNARAFYEKFISENVEFSKFQPDLIRQKMRNLRAAYTKTNDWYTSSGILN